ncbi:zinc finger protein 680-like isoform X1 [Octopus sinensis]|uniref:Zinc finger protein 680-like isoform X1 n=1 Tax=Octopus sinensis TaxID=2607531 RepID=A0A7E6FBB7_9MOLL|nr:zinc finger protein 680-like isoform X1 [Octopus sinensis]XP_036364250.1 zinc finger protein 680-like isoform X1 [Octopus sinensis]XP_036364251.1 zinc finger protein 680-like isoform X1 [Octopus sinensis]XP_036364252.1 zinc finger protein 680-like isoform X1 [Octopus sinensis]XP_036364253.1 zinc finger protein 680-like isoform X1 [Octopus sinensis]
MPKIMGKSSYHCDICKKPFSREVNLIAHKRVCAEVKPYHCNTCGKAFTGRRDLTKHKCINTNEKPHRCDICGKAFSYEGSLTIHKYSHTGEKPHHCDICGKSFSQKGNLTIHRRSHTGEKPYRCEICGKAFPSSGELTNHKYSHTMSILLWIPLSFGCVEEAMRKYFTCLTQTNITQNILTSNLTTEHIEAMCREKETLFQCMSKVTECSTYTREMLLTGIDINSMRQAYDKLCQRKDEFTRDLPCLEKYSSAMEKSFAAVIEERSDLRQKLSYSDITFDEYFKKYCPMWKKVIDNLPEVIGCPKTFVEILQDYFYSMMPEKCKDITEQYRPEDNGSSNVIFKGGQMYFSFILFLIFVFATE